jgi:hypothetical protein
MLPSVGDTAKAVAAAITTRYFDVIATGTDMMDALQKQATRKTWRRSTISKSCSEGSIQHIFAIAFYPSKVRLGAKVPRTWPRAGPNMDLSYTQMVRFARVVILSIHQLADANTRFG